MIEIYTDGSCIGNPGPGGWGAILLTDAGKIILKGGHPETTNNRMEMQAVISALEWAKEHNASALKIHSDSNLIVQTMTKGWKKKANTDLWAQIDSLAPKMQIEWQWVKAHANNALNNEVDKIALSEAQKQARA